MEPETIKCAECQGDGWLIYWSGDYHTGGATGHSVQADCDICFGEGVVDNPNWKDE